LKTKDLFGALEAIFCRDVARVRRVRSPYSSTFTIDELEVVFENGETIATIFKNLSPDAILETARSAKPHFLYMPEREIEVYRSLLSSTDLGTAKIYGARVKPEVRQYLLFLENVCGEKLAEIGDFEVWLTVARWLARFHTSFETDAARAAVPQLLECDASYYRQWLERARARAGSALDGIAQRYEHVVDTLVALPPVFIHGEFFASNILVRQEHGAIRVCPVDWEMAATGPGLMDLAALASGKWNRDERLSILENYHSMLGRRLSPQDAVVAFDCCQLHYAIQWLGWSADWSPPAEHAHDWLQEALQIAQVLQL